MTPAEFAKGWKLLILQPWGWRYRSLTPEGKPSEESQTQMELYYSKLQWATPEAWHYVVNLFVEGNEWPSIQELKQALQNVNHRYVKTIPPPKPEPVSADDAKKILRGVFGRS